jgi:hypothetical protein
MAAARGVGGGNGVAGVSMAAKMASACRSENNQ